MGLKIIDLSTGVTKRRKANVKNVEEDIFLTQFNMLRAFLIYKLRSESM